MSNCHAHKAGITERAKLGGSSGWAQLGCKLWLGGAPQHSLCSLDFGKNAWKKFWGESRASIFSVVSKGAVEHPRGVPAALRAAASSGPCNACHGEHQVFKAVESRVSFCVSLLISYKPTMEVLVWKRWRLLLCLFLFLVIIFAQWRSKVLSSPAYSNI